MVEDKGGIEKIVNQVIDGFGKTWAGNIKTNPDNAKNTLNEALKKPIQEYEKQISELTAKVGNYETQVSELETDINQTQEEYSSLRRAITPIYIGVFKTLKPIVNTLPMDVVEPLLSKLYESGEDNPLLDALESRYNEIENAEIEQAEAEDKKNAEEVGMVTQYFPELKVAEISVVQPLNKGDHIYIKGPDTDFIQLVESMEKDHNKIEEAKPGEKIGVKLHQEVKEGDTAYKMV